MSRIASRKTKLKQKILDSKGKRRHKVKLTSTEQKYDAVSTENEVVERNTEEKDLKSHQQHLLDLKDTDPDFYQFLIENDEKLLNFSESEDEADMQSESGSTNAKEESDKYITGDSTDEDIDDDNLLEGQLVTVDMVRDWSGQLKKDHSLKDLKRLCSSLHCGVITMLSSTDDNPSSMKHHPPYQVKGGQVFNAVVIACLRYVRPSLEYHFPSSDKSQKPSSLKNWGNLKVIIKTYLTDILQLLHGVAQKSMVCALLRHIEGLWRFFSCFPKLSRYLCRDLIKLWSESSEEASVLAYLILRRSLSHLKEFKLEDILKRMYLAYIRNSRLTTPSTIQHIQFMCGTLVEVLSFTPGLAYQLVFLYTRHLANQLRRSFKGDKTVSIASWPFIHSLVLFASVLSTLTNEVFSPLVYPVTQVSLGLVQLLNASKFVPLRLHIVEILLEITEKRGTFIPLAPILLEVFETHAVSISHKQVTGKLPSLSCTLKLSKMQIGSRSTQTAVLNYTLELLLRLLSQYSSYISFPEIVFPITTRLRKVMKKTPLTWLRHHLKQVIEKSNEVCRSIANERSSVDFSPKDEDKIKAWETRHTSQKNSLKKFYETWKVIQQQTQEDTTNAENEEGNVEDETKEVVQRKRKRSPNSDSRSTKQKISLSDLNFELSDIQNEEEEDILEELQMSSDDENQ